MEILAKNVSRNIQESQYVLSGMVTKLALLIFAVGFAGGQLLNASPEALMSPRLAALEADLKAGKESRLRSFWEEVERQGAPLVEARSSKTSQVLVTFVWRGRPDIKQVFVLSLMAVAPDKTRMTRLLDTDLWYKTYELRDDAHFTYGFYASSNADPNDDPSNHPDQLKPDPFNSKRFELPPNDKQKDPPPLIVLSVLELRHAPDRSWSTPHFDTARGLVSEHYVHSSILEADRRIWVYTPHGYLKGSVNSLVVLFDGFDYLHEIPTPAILDNLQASGRIPPVVAVLVDTPPSTRAQDLFCSDSFTSFIARELIPWVTEKYGFRTVAGTTVVGGSSLGGLAAAFAGLRHPDVFGNVLSQSGSYWWNPDQDPEPEWLAREYAQKPPLLLRFHLDVGLFEEMPTPGGETNLIVNRHFRDVLIAKGYRVHFQAVNGGHDFLSWQSTLVNGLLELIGKADSGEASPAPVQSKLWKTLPARVGKRP